MTFEIKCLRGTCTQIRQFRLQNFLFTMMSWPPNLVSKFIRLVIFLLIIIFCSILYLLGDSVIAKLNSPAHLGFCKLCAYNKNVSVEVNSLPFYMSLGNVVNESEDVIQVLLVYAFVNKNHQLRNKLSTCLSSLFTHTSSALHIHIVTDVSSLRSALLILQNASPLVSAPTQITCHDVNNITKPLEQIIETMRPHFSEKRGAYYSNPLFYISIGLYKVFPQQRVIMIDIDVKFMDDIRDLYDHFNNFSSSAVIGIAREQQPVYRHVLNEYRRFHNNTKAGNPPPDGLTGFNSGVLLLNLQGMRNLSQYSQIIDNSSITLQLVKKYKFKGHLGDQDFYSLLSLEYNELFYVLPCTWNRQLCQWWKNHGYQNVFNQYHACDGKIHLLHGNCNTFIPDSL